jgi:hypothetical protein
VVTLSVLPKFGKKFSLRFFSAGGNRRKCESDSFSLPKFGKKFSLRFFSAGGNLKKGGSKINIPAKSTYVEFVPGFFDIKNWPGNTLLTLKTTTLTTTLITTLTTLATTPTLTKTPTTNLTTRGLSKLTPTKTSFKRNVSFPQLTFSHEFARLRADLVTQQRRELRLGQTTVAQHCP